MIEETIDNAIRDYGLSDDAMRWTPIRPPTTELTPEQIEAIRAGIQNFAEQVRELFARIARQLQAAGIVPLPKSVDPMQRALEARRNRNTGPLVPLRVPRRINPSRGLRP